MSDKNALSKIAATSPEHIWLDLGEEAHLVEDETTFKDLAGVTWSEDNATGHGIEYLRADAISHPATQAGALQALSDEQIMEIGHRHFKPEPDLTDSAKAAFVASVRECIALAATQPNASCDHEWVSMRNKVITSGEICAKLCGAIRPEQPNAAPGDGHVWLKCDGCGKDMRSHDRMGHCPAPGDGQGAVEQPITAAIMVDDGGERRAYCLMAAYASEQGANNAMRAILAAPIIATAAREQEEASLQYPEALACLSSVLRAASHVVVTNGAQPKLDRLREVVSRASEWLAAEESALAPRHSPAATGRASQGKSSSHIRAETSIQSAGFCTGYTGGKGMSIETPEQRARRLGVPFAKPRGDQRPYEHNPIVAVCGLCGRDVYRIEGVSCSQSRCPIQPKAY